MDNDLDDFVLPVLPHSEPCLPATQSFVKPSTRKRPFLRSREASSVEDQLASAINTSSDPAMFSSDETPDAENYSGGVKRRKKKTYEGTWWGEKIGKRRGIRASSSHGPTKKRSFRRNFDSGIFMADDSSATDLSSEGLLEQELFEVQQKNEMTGKLESLGQPHESRKTSQFRQHQSFTDAALKLPPQSRSVNTKDLAVRAVVQKCLDKNDENVDWTSMGLDSLPISIKDLKSMIKRINSDVVENKLAPFEAELKVYLGNNNFSQFPSPLLELTNMRLLSLRQNCLTELPSGMRDLLNLQDINLSSNSLEYLPFEIMQLLLYGNLKTIHESPNPWKPIPATEDRIANLPCLTIASTKMFNLYRVVVSKPEEILPDGSYRLLSERVGPHSRQPHLSEIVLRALLRHNTSKADLSSYLTDDHPDSSKGLLKTLHAAQSSGGRSCTFCTRDMVLPRWQWYEWWNMQPYSIDHQGQDGLITHMEETRISLPITTVIVDHRQTHQRSNFDVDALKDSLLPFQRMACGCVDVETGLNQELEKLYSISAKVEVLCRGEA